MKPLSTAAYRYDAYPSCNLGTEVHTTLHLGLQAMNEIWGHGNHVQCMHPAAECIEGREDVGLQVPSRLVGDGFAHMLLVTVLQVLESWRVVLRGEFQIKLEDVRVYATQDIGYVTCVEVMNAGNAKGR